jgi:succinoglycan biosynthesis transport protein ExoP
MVAPADHSPQDPLLGNNVSPYLTYLGPAAYSDPEAAEPSPAGAPGLPELLHSLRRQWLLGALIGACCAVVAAGAVWMAQKPTHTSVAFLRISARDAPLIFETADRSGRPDFKTYLATQQQLMLTPLVLNAALRSEPLAGLPRVKAQTDPVEWLQRELKVKFEAEIGQVSFTDREPAVAKAVVDGVVAAYMEEVVLAEENIRRQRLSNLERVYAEAESKVRAKRAEMRNLVEAVGSGDSESLSLAQQGAVQEFGLYRNELTRVQFELMRAQGELALRTSALEPSAESSDGSEDDDASAHGAGFVSTAVKKAIQSDPVATGLAQEIARLQGTLAQVQRRFTPAAAAERVAKYQAQIEELERQFTARCEEIERDLAAQRPGMTADGTEDLAFRIAVLQQQERELLDQVARREAEAKKFGRSSIDVEMMRAEVASLDGVLSRIGEEIERTKVELRSGTRTAVISPASVPQAEDRKRRAAVSAAAGFAGFGAPLALLVVLDVRRRRIDGVATITDRLRLDVLGVVPHVPQRVLRRIGTESPRALRWQERLVESIDTVTAMILRKATLEDRRVILVSSAVAGEGKTMLAGQLGGRLADTGHRTLLIDFDLRRPTLHEAFDAALEPGVADVLRDAAPLAEAVQATDHPNLFLVAAGAGAANLLNAATRGALDRLFQAVRSDYEFVIVDCSPVLPVVDTRLIGQFGDGIILSVLRDISEAPKVAAARTILQSHGAHLMGTVVTGCSQDVYFETRQSALATT